MIRSPNISRPASRESGFTLVEIIASLLLVGIITAFSGILLARSIESYILARDAAESAVNAQVAMERLGLELKSIDALQSTPVDNTSISYTSTDSKLTGTRIIIFAGDAIFINDGSANHKLLDGISNPSLTVGYFTINGTEYVAYIDIGFQINTMPAFNTRIYPRGMVEKYS